MKQLQPATIDPSLLIKLHVKSPSKQRDSWKYTRGYPRTFKDAITEQMQVNQSKRCAYCGSRLLGEQPHRDHVAPKEKHPEYTFLPENLVLACYHCNSECKGAYDTVSVKGSTYRRCSFSIVHPHLDNPASHIEFVGGENAILVRVVNNSSKGIETIRLFKLDSPELSKQRAKDALLDSDLTHLPGKWQDAVTFALSTRLKGKVNHV